MAGKNKNANGAGDIRKRSDGRWEGRYTTGFDPKTGKQIRKSVYGKTQKEVKQALTKILTEIDEDIYIEPSKVKLSDWLQTWMTDYSCDKKYSTLKGYRAQINAHINPALGKYTLEQISPVMVQKFYNSLSVPDENGKYLAPKSIKNVHMILRASFQQAVENEYLRDNPCDKARLPKIYKQEVKPLSDEDVSNFLTQTELDPIYGPLLKLIIFTGLREGEAMGITWDCVDFKSGSIMINKQLQRRPQSAGGTVLTSVKNGKPRVLRPAPFVMELLKARYSQQNAQCEAAGEAWEAWTTEAEHKKALVFTSEVGGYLIPKRVYLHYKKIANAIGLPESRVHDLRHTYAVLSLQNGDDIKTVQINLGHSSAAFTLDVYGHVSDRMQRESASRMEEYIKSLTCMKNA